MDALGWIVAIVILLLFGKNLTLNASIPLSNSNAVPTSSDNLPIMSNQNTGNPPDNQPAPWRTACNPTGGVTLPPIVVANPIVSQSMPQSISLPMVSNLITKSQPRY